MPEHGTRHNAASLLAALRSKGLTREEGLADFILRRQQAKPPPLYLNILMAIGAFIAGLLFFVVLFEETSASVIVLFIVALMLVAGAVWLHKQAGDGHGIKYSILTQSSLTMMIVGKVALLLIFGVWLDYYYLSKYGYDELWSVTLALLIITILTYPVYRIFVDRFVSSFIALCFILFNILNDSGEYMTHRALLFHGFFLFQFAIAAVLLTHGKLRSDYIPLAYALVFSLCVNVLLLAFVPWKHIGVDVVISPHFASLVLSGGLIALFGYVAGGMTKLKTAPLRLAVMGAALLGLISAPGILLAITLMVLGYARHERLLLATGAALIPVFLFLYYYQLDMTLLQKSGVLVGSGALLLAARLYLRHRGWRASACLPPRPSV